MRNFLTGGELTTDNRGRVRFGYDGIRFEVTKTGLVNLYRRYGVNEYRRISLDQRYLGNPDVLRTLANAIELATAHGFARPSFELAAMA